jgi:hypothetical protein
MFPEKEKKMSQNFFFFWLIPPGLPDFSSSNRPKAEKYIPNDHKLHQEAVNNTK